MPFVLVWKPVLRPLALREYHPDFGDETILVCVNPSPETVKRRDDLAEENAKRFVQSAEPDAGLKNKKAQRAQTGKKVNEYIQWRNEIYLPALDQWFADLWSFGDDKYAVENIKQYRDVDPAFATWLFVQTDLLMKEHSTGKKKN